MGCRRGGLRALMILKEWFGGGSVGREGETRGICEGE
jgi:hypothetical protein